MTRLDDAELMADPVLAALDPDLDSVLNVNTPAEYRQARARPEPVVSVRLAGPLAAGDDDRGPRLLRASTIEAAARAAGLGFGRQVAAALNGAPVTGDGTTPLAAGDTVLFRRPPAPGRRPRRCPNGQTAAPRLVRTPDGPLTGTV